MIKEKSIGQPKLLIYNGELILEGGFKVMDNLKVNRVARGSYELSIDEIRINLSDITNSDINIDDLEVGFYVDNGNLGIGIPDIYAIDFENNSQVAGINEELLKSASVNFNIFPNPSNTFFELDYSGKEEAHFEIRLTDLQGSLVTVLSENEQLAPKQKKRFDISDVAKGVYLIQLVNENNIYSRKLIVQ